MPVANTNQSIAVIGCGYIGSAVGEALVRVGHDVIGTTTSAARVDTLRGLGIKPELVEVADVDRLHTLLGDREAVYLTIAPGRQGRDYRSVYLAGAKNLLAAAEETPVRRIIYTSSTRVYGQEDGSWVDESSPTVPKDERGRILLETEAVLLNGAHALGGDTTVGVTALRLSGIYGPGRDPAERIKTLAGTQRGDGDAYVNLIHRDDIVATLVALLDKPHHGVLNLSDHQPEPRRAFYDRILASAGLRPIQWVRGDGPSDLGKRIRNDLVKKTLNLSLKHPKH